MMLAATHTILVSVLLYSSAGTLADDISLGPVKDNTIYGIYDIALSNGAGRYMFTGRTNSGSQDVRRALISFDISSIPPGSVITEASLTMNMSRTVADEYIVTLHRLLADWGEAGSDAGEQGGGGAPAEPGDATIYHRFHDTIPWNVIGGDYDFSPSSAALVGSEGSYTWTGPGLIADLQLWVAEPDQNFGWMIKGNEAIGGTAKRFDTRENVIAANRPRLDVSYTPPPPDTGMFGDDVTASFEWYDRDTEFPGTPTWIADVVTATVGPGVEFPGFGCENLCIHPDIWDIDVDNSTILITAVDTGPGTSFSFAYDQPHVGPHLRDADGSLPAFESVILLESTVSGQGVQQHDIRFWDDDIYINYEGCLLRPYEIVHLEVIFGPACSEADVASGGTSADVIDFDDLVFLLGAWTGDGSYAPCPPRAPGDLDHDCDVDFDDLSQFLGFWGPCP